MKKLTRLFVMGVVILPFMTSLTSCLQDSCNREVTFVQHEPVYKTLEEIRVPIASQPAQEMVNPGKIYYYNDFIFINEREEGIHVIDNSNPSSPMPTSFIPIPGNVDIAVKNNVLLADNYIDLVAIDISNPNAVNVLQRSEHAFPNDGQQGDALLVAYTGNIVTDKVDCEWAGGNDVTILADSADPSFAGQTVNESSATGRFAGGTGTGGSMSRFTIVGNNLYTVDGSSMHIFDLNSLTKGNVINLGLGIETIYPYEDKLFIGANSGMFIYDNSNPDNPTFISAFEHVRACDPVVVDGDYAYVTLHTSTECQGWVNALEVIDISNINAPTLINSYNLTQPKGLSVTDSHLFVCDGHNGLQVFNKENTPNLSATNNLTGFNAYDVIAVPSKNLLLVVGEDGIRQYDATQPNALKLLSTISTN